MRERDRSLTRCTTQVQNICTNIRTAAVRVYVLIRV